MITVTQERGCLLYRCSICGKSRHRAEGKSDDVNRRDKNRFIANHKQCIQDAKQAKS